MARGNARNIPREVTLHSVMAPVPSLEHVDRPFPPALMRAKKIGRLPFHPVKGYIDFDLGVPRDLLGPDNGVPDRLLHLIDQCLHLVNGHLGCRSSGRTVAEHMCESTVTPSVVFLSRSLPTVLRKWFPLVEEAAWVDVPMSRAIPIGEVAIGRV